MPAMFALMSNASVPRSTAAATAICFQGAPARAAPSAAGAPAGVATSAAGAGSDSIFTAATKR